MLIDTLIDTTNVADWDANQHLSGATVFNVQNIYDWFMETRPEGDRLISVVADIPNAAPLAPLCWFEYSNITGSGNYQQMGAFLEYIDCYDPDPGSPEDPYVTRRMAEERGVRWCAYQSVFARVVTPGGAVSLARSSFGTIYCIGPSGKIDSVTAYVMGTDREMWHTDGVRLATDDPRHQEHILEHFVGYLGMLATCFAHCKGVTITTTEPTRNDRRRAERTGARPPMIFRTLDIRPATRILRESGATGDHQGVRWHMVRGHFKHYTEDAPLFGRHTGTYYVPQHARGDMLRGLVAKRYKSHPEGEPCPRPVTTPSATSSRSQTPART